MTRAATLEYGAKTQGQMLHSAPFRENFIRSKFPSYKIGPKGGMLEPNLGKHMQSLKEIVAKETVELLDRRQRLSVRELTIKFEKGLNTATWLSDEVKWRQAALLERDVILKKLRNLLELLGSRMAGRNKDEIEESISMVETLAVQLSEREAELVRQKEEVTKLATSLKLASEDTKKIVEEERASARMEIDNARAAVQRVQKAFHEKEKISQRIEKKDMENLRAEVQEARRVKMLHHPSKVMDMENEIQALRNQLVEKSSQSVHLLREMEMIRVLKEKKVISFQIEGLQSLGSTLSISPSKDIPFNLSSCSIQWYRNQSQSKCSEAISGATRPFYAPEPFDVGRYLEAHIMCGNECITARTAGTIDPAAGLGEYVEALLRKSETEFNVVVLQMNGTEQPSQLIHTLNIGKLRMRLGRGKTIIAKEFYSSSMQLCGVRGGGNAAPSSIFWQAHQELSITLGFESARERNAAIMLARRYAADCNIVLAGPGDKHSA